MNVQRVLSDLVAAAVANDVYPDQTVDELVAWYTIALQNHLVYYIYEDSKLAGFIDGFHMPVEPKSIEDIKTATEFYPFDVGHYGVITGACVLKGKNTLRRLIHLLKLDHPEWETITWHSNKKKTMKTFRNIKNSKNNKNTKDM